MSLVSVAVALERVLADTVPLGPETAAIADADGRVLALDLAAKYTLPPFAACRGAGNLWAALAFPLHETMQT